MLLKLGETFEVEVHFNNLYLRAPLLGEVYANASLRWFSFDRPDK